MKLIDLMKKIETMVTDNPEILEYNLVYSSDDEGNNFNLVNFSPSLGEYIQGEFESDSDNNNSICIN